MFVLYFFTSQEYVQGELQHYRKMSASPPFTSVPSVPLYITIFSLHCCPQSPFTSSPPFTSYTPLNIKVPPSYHNPLKTSHVLPLGHLSFTSQNQVSRVTPGNALPSSIPPSPSSFQYCLVTWKSRYTALQQTSGLLCSYLPVDLL